MHKRYVSWERDEPDREWAGLRVLAEHAPGLAPRPLRREMVSGAPIVVMSRLPGRELGDRPVSVGQVRGVALALRRLWAVPVEAAREVGLQERTSGPTTFRGSVSDWATEDHDLSVCRDPGLVLEALASARGWLDSPNATPGEVVDPVLGQADGNLANLLWDGEVCRLVDFEDCGLSDPAYELADLVEHASGRLSGLLDPAALMAAVGLTDEQLARCADYRRLMAAFWLVMLLPGNRGFTRNPAGSIENQAAHLLSLLSE